MTNTVPQTSPKWRIHKRPLIIIGVVVAVLAIAAAVGVHYSQPYLRDLAEDMLSSQLRSDVQIQDFHVRLLPSLTISGKGIVLRHHGRTDVPPLFSIGEFSATASLWSIPVRPWHIEQVTLKGLKIQIPPREKRQGSLFGGFKSKHNVTVRIDEIISDDAELDIIPGDPDKPVHQFLIHHLKMTDIGPGHGAPFQADLTNATPPGEIRTKGKFGPWQSDDPRSTPLEANYTFQNADLNVFKGISGILSSEGHFNGVLEKIEVEGETTTPDFSVDTADYPVMLKTDFNATVDGTNGDTLLHPVVAHFLNTTLVCNGAIVKPQEKDSKGKEIKLDVVSAGARIEDLLRLVVKSSKPLMTGKVNLRTSFDLPPHHGEKVLDRLALEGKFGVSGAEFTEEKVRNKIEDLSRRAQGHPDDEDAGDSVSQLKGNFGLGDGIISLKKLTFSVTGASVDLDGTYGLRSEKLDFHGQLHMEAKPSQAVSGIKSWLLKPFDPFFRKNGQTVIPIKVTGTRTQPSFGLDFHHNDKSENQRAPSKSSSSAAE